MPYKLAFGLLLFAWLALFFFLGNSTLGYVHSPSLYTWLDWMYKNSGDDAHGRYIPLVVLALFWWKRAELLQVPKRPWAGGIPLLLFALGLQVVAHLVQQTQISVVSFFLGLYALTGVVWGPGWLRASFFPFCLFAFCLPIGNVSGPVTLGLRLVATKITSLVCHLVLGIDVVQSGTRLLDPNGAYEYEVAAACSGIRSLTATTALAVIYAFVSLKQGWRRGLVIFSAVPLAVASNVVRLSAIVVAAQAFGREAGNYVHSSSVFSLLPYVPAIAGLLFLGWLLREDRGRGKGMGKGNEPGGPVVAGEARAEL